MLTLLLRACGATDDCQTSASVRMREERAVRQGPWLQDPWVAPSADGRTLDLSQARRLVSGAAVPKIVRAPRGGSSCTRWRPSDDHGRRHGPAAGPELAGFAPELLAPPP
jgi:hypothetical protein